MEFARLPVLVQLFVIASFATAIYAFGNNLISQSHPAFTANASWSGGFGTTMTSFGFFLVVVAVCVVLNRARLRVAVMRIASYIITLLASIVRVFEPLVTPLLDLGTPESELEPQAEPADLINLMESGLGDHLA